MDAQHEDFAVTPELLSPAGGFDAALAAFQYGADAIYLGLPRFSARADADNLSSDRLRTLLAYARTFSPAKKIYVTLNTLVQDAELPQALDALDTLDALAPDGIIVQDLGVARLARQHFPRLALHASTQLAAHNLDGVLALKDLGFTRVVLARELTLDEIALIVRESGVEIEIFVHGALCYSVSGLCLFSSHTAGRSGNRGRCAYCCRESFTPDLSPSDRRPPAAGYPFSMRDLALAPLLDRVAATGAHSLKIEGRMKSPLYVACVTDYYRRKLDGTLGAADERALIQDLQTVFSRPWTNLYAEDAGAPPDAVIDPVSIGHRGAPIGNAEAVCRDREGVRWLRFKTSRALEKHDGLQVDLPEGGKPFGCAVHLLRAAGTLRPVITLPAGATVEVALPDADVPAIPRGATVFCSASQAVRRRYEIRSVRESSLQAGRPVDARVTLAPDGIGVKLETALEQPGDVRADTFLPLALTPSRQPEQTGPAARKAFERLGDTAWRLGAFALEDPRGLYAPASKLNEARRAACAALTAEWGSRRAARRAAVAAEWGFTPSATPLSAHGDVCPSVSMRTQEQCPHEPQGQPTAPAARWTLKLRADGPLLSRDLLSGFDAVVLAIGHLPLPALTAALAGWRAALPAERLRLALPLLSRERELPDLKAALRTLTDTGWRDWECADLAGVRMLTACGVTPVSADWSLYALNRAAAAELARLGIRSYVLSPESSLENLCALLHVPTGSPTERPHMRTSPVPEQLVYQQTPLFISETAPCLSAAGVQPVELTDRRGRRFTVRELDGRWVTVWNSAFCVADMLAGSGCDRFRIDLSCSPDPDSFAGVIRTVLSGRCPADTHRANVTRGLA